MLAEIKVKLTSRIMGDLIKGKDSPRLLPGDEHSLFHPPEHVAYAVSQAIESLKLENIHPSTIQLRREYRKPRVMLVTRRFSRGGRRDLKEIFQAVDKGAVLTWEATLGPPRPEFQEECGEVMSVTEPTLRELEQVMRFIGIYVGLSPWGNLYNMGRFKVLGVKQKTEISDFDQQSSNSDQECAAPGDQPNQSGGRKKADD